MKVMVVVVAVVVVVIFEIIMTVVFKEMVFMVVLYFGCCSHWGLVFTVIVVNHCVGCFDGGSSWKS